MCLNADGFVGADAVTRQTGEADVFAGGAATGAHDVARAIAEGREAAISIHRFVHSNQSFVIGRDKRDYKPLARSSVGVAIDELESAPRQAAENGLLSDAQLHCEAGAASAAAPWCSTRISASAAASAQPSASLTPSISRRSTTRTAAAISAPC